MLRMNDNPHGQLRATDPGRDGRIPDDEPPRDMVGGGGRVRLRTDRAGAEGAPIPPVEQRAEGNRERFSGQGHHVESGADDAADSALDPDAADREEAGAPPPFSPALYFRRHRRAGGGGCGTRGSVGSRGAAPVQARLERVWRPSVRAAGGHLVVAHLQSAEVGGIPEDSSAGAAHASSPGVDRRTPQAGPERAARLYSRGHGASGATRRQAGRVSSQRGRYGDAVGSVGLYGNHQREPSDSGAGGDAASVPVSHSGLSLRQRIGVYQSHRRQAIEQITGGGVHQVAGLPHHRQCLGGRQEWGCGAQADRLWRHRRRACRRASEVLHGSPQSVSELPPSLRLCHYRNQRARQAQAEVSAQRLSDALRETDLAEELGEMLKAWNHCGPAETTSGSSQRHRGSPADAERQVALVGSLPETPGEPVKRTGKHLRSTVEMTGPRKPWKTKPRFSTVPTAPWKSPSRFPHSHRADDWSLFSHLNRSRPSGACNRKPTQERTLLAALRMGRPTPPCSGSSRVGINFHFQAHLWIGKCCSPLTLRFGAHERAFL